MKQIGTERTEKDGKVYITKIYEPEVKEPQFNVGDIIFYYEPSTGNLLYCRYIGDGKGYFIRDGVEYISFHEFYKSTNTKSKLEFTERELLNGLKWCENYKEYKKAIAANKKGEHFWEGEKAFTFDSVTLNVGYLTVTSGDIFVRNLHKTRHDCRLGIAEHIASQQGYKLVKE